MNKSIENRYEFAVIFDVKDGNPNGDPDAGNMPRIDPETGQGIVTDVCLKRKVRNYVQLAKDCVRPYDIYIKERAVLNHLLAEAYEQDGMAEAEGYDRVQQARQWMCASYWDVRTFGALMSSGKNAGQVRGPVQMTFARSVDPILIIDNCIVRQAVATAKEAEKQTGENRTMGRKYIIPYALYVCQGYVSANLAAQSGFTDEDLELLWNGLQDMFEDDRSAARGQMSVRKLIIFRHHSKLGNAQSNKLFASINIEKLDPTSPARSYTDYKVTIDKTEIPKGVDLIERI